MRNGTHIAEGVSDELLHLNTFSDDILRPEVYRLGVGEPQRY
jgi:hypothetical protein